MMPLEPSGEPATAICRLAASKIGQHSGVMGKEAPSIKLPSSVVATVGGLILWVGGPLAEPRPACDGGDDEPTATPNMTHKVT